MTTFTQAHKLEMLKAIIKADNPAVRTFVEIRPPLSKSDWSRLVAWRGDLAPLIYSSAIGIVVREAEQRITMPFMVIDEFPPDEFTDEFTVLDYTLANYFGCYEVDGNGKPIQPSDAQWEARLSTYE